MPPLPVFDLSPIANVALGAALVAMRQEFPYPPENISDNIDQAGQDAALRGAKMGLDLALKQVMADLEGVNRLLKR